MNKRVVIAIFAVLALAAIVGIVFAGNNTTPVTSSSTNPTTDSARTETAADVEPQNEPSSAADTSECPISESAVIVYQNGEFSPGCITVKSGTRVTWQNKGSSSIQIGADPHPSHTGNKEVSSNDFVLSIAAGEQATSTLTTKGNHGYHDHLNARAEGIIVVE